MQDYSLQPIPLKPGESHEFHQFSVTNPPVLIVEVSYLLLRVLSTMGYTMGCHFVGCYVEVESRNAYSDFLSHTSTHINIYIIHARMQIPDEKMSGRLRLSPQFPDHSSFIVGKDQTTVVWHNLFDTQL